MVLPLDGGLRLLATGVEDKIATRAVYKASLTAIFFSFSFIRADFVDTDVSRVSRTT